MIATNRIAIDNSQSLCDFCFPHSTAIGPATASTSAMADKGDPEAILRSLTTKLNDDGGLHNPVRHIRHGLDV